MAPAQCVVLNMMLMYKAFLNGLNTSQHTFKVKDVLNAATKGNKRNVVHSSNDSFLMARYLRSIRNTVVNGYYIEMYANARKKAIRYKIWKIIPKEVLLEIR